MGANRTRQKKKGNASSFDETALAQLTAQLDTSLPKSGGEVQGKRKRPQDTDDRPDSSKRQARNGSDKKRREREVRESGKSGNATNVLLDEILALGGDEEDYKLVAGIDSDNEEGQDTHKKPSNSVPDNSLREELAKFASTLGFEHVSHNDDVDTDNGEFDEAESHDEDESEGDVEGQSEEQDRVTTKGKDALSAGEARQGKSNGKLLFEPRPDWHSVGVEDTNLTADQKALGRYTSSVANLKAFAESLLEQDSATYAAMQSSSSTQKFMSTIMSSGTLSDKVSALTLSIQESPVHSRKAFENLISLAGKKSRGQAIAALGALVDLLGNGNVLPGDRRLRPFVAQPALLGALQEDDITAWAQGQQLPGSLSQSHLVMWAYEDWLKGAFFRIIQLLEVWCSDEIEYSRSRALDFIFGLLRSKPEQEANLLCLLVNKLGDRERKIASRASYLILQLLEGHPGMKPIVINALEQEVLLKPGQSLRAKYYAINTLNQTILSGKEPAVADTLLRIYFETFVSLLKSGLLGSFDALEADEKAKKDKGGGGGDRKRRNRKSQATDSTTQEQESTQKLVSSLLTGVNRALPFTASDDTTLEKHIDTLFRITHSSNFNTSVQALMLIQQLATSKFLAVDRFYRTLYESLLDPRLITSSKQALYLNLLYRSLKNDVDVRRVKAFVKRLVQVLGLHQPSFACGILFLIAELEGTFPDLRALINVPEDTGDEEEEVYKDFSDKDATTATVSPVAGSTTGYDGRKRNPEHSNAHRSCLWEIVPFLKHFHPSVNVFAANLLERQKSLPKPDLANHTLMHFLDKFVYRNPKATDVKRGGSIMQPVLASDTSHVLVSGKATARQPSINSASFWNLKSEDVSAEDAFFHEYFAKVGKPSETSKSKKAAKADDAGSGDEEEENEIWEALVNSRPEVEGGDDDEESDVDMEGYSDSESGLDDGALDAHGLSDMESDGSGGFEGIFDDSEEEEDIDAEEDEAEAEVDAVQDGRRKKRMNRKELKSLPTFASIDDYAEMLAGEEEGI